MRIRCPFCGERESGEFTYLGDATCRPPQPGSQNAATEYFEAVYLRANPRGSHEELWYPAAGCRSWLRVTRDTHTHEISAVSFANDVTAA
jgi:methylglutamate dehydrogenase subunit B